MKKRTWLTLLSGFLFSLLFVSGIGRDDVPLKKYYRFADNPVFDCVGEVYYKNEFQLSCVLIDDRHILTAGHAFEFSNDSFVADSEYDEIMNKWTYGKRSTGMYFGNAPDFYIKISGKKYKIRNIYIHEIYKNKKPIHDAKGVHTSPDYEYDIAVAELETPVKGVKPAILNEDGNELHQRAIFAGYGEIERANEFVNDQDSGYMHKRRKMGGENMIDSIGAFKVGNNHAGLFFDFDAPNSNCCNRMGSATALPYEYFPDAGDCGSGMFIQENGIWKLVAICAATDVYSEYALYGKRYWKYYGFTCYYQRVFAFKDWIRAQVLKK